MNLYRLTTIHLAEIKRVVREQFGVGKAVYSVGFGIDDLDTEEMGIDIRDWKAGGYSSDLDRLDGVLGYSVPDGAMIEVVCSTVARGDAESERIGHACVRLSFERDVHGVICHSFDVVDFPPPPKDVPATEPPASASVDDSLEDALATGGREAYQTICETLLVLVTSESKKTRREYLADQLRYRYSVHAEEKNDGHTERADRTAARIDVLNLLNNLVSNR